MKHVDRCTLLRNGGDEKDILTRRLFDVNMRLFHANSEYRSLVQCVCDWIRECAMTEAVGYKPPHGYSGANAGIPWNIIALADGTVMINPKIVDNGGGTIRYSESNCGSLMLDKPIEIWRWANITVDYFDREGSSCRVTGYLPTVQHEIDHNNGILITDRKRE